MINPTAQIEVGLSALSGDTRLHELRLGDRILCKCSDGSAHVVFDHIDGMYSFCRSENGSIVHLSMMQKLEPVSAGVFQLAGGS